MSEKLQGNLAETPIADVVRDLVNQGASGLINLSCGSRRGTLCFQHGRIRFAFSNLKRLGLQQLLEESGVVNKDALAGVSLESGSQGLIATLVQNGNGDRPALVAVVRDLLEAVVMELVTWTEGEFEFLPGNPALKNEVLIESTAADLLVRATQTHGFATSDSQASRSDSPFVAESETPTETTTDREPEGPGAQDTAPGDAVHADLRARLEQSQSQNLYEILDVETTENVDGIRSAYYRLARKYHPDAYRGRRGDTDRDESERFFAAATEAYNRLTDAEERKIYDEDLKIQRSTKGTERQDPSVLARKNYEQGCVQAEKGALADASRFFENAVHLEPEKAEHHRELGIIQMQNPRWQKAAEESLRKAVDLAPMDARALAHLGLLYQMNGLSRRAEDLFQRTLQWDPENEIAIRCLTDPGDDKDSGGGLLKGLLRGR